MRCAVNVADVMASTLFPAAPAFSVAVFQAVKAFELFTGTTPDDQRMLRHFAALGGATA